MPRRQSGSLYIDAIGQKRFTANIKNKDVKIDFLTFCYGISTK